MHRLSQFFIAFSFLVALAGCGADDSQLQQQFTEQLSRAGELIEVGNERQARQVLFGVTTRFARNAGEVDLGVAYTMLGVLYAEAAAFDSALIMYQRAIEEYKGVSDRAAAHRTTLTIARLHRIMGDEHRAHTLLEEALRLARVFNADQEAEEIQWAMLPTLRSLELPDKESAILTALHKRARDTNDPRRLGNLMMQSGLGKARRGNHTGAAQDFLQAVTLATQLRDTLLLVQSMIRLGDAFEHTGRPREAMETYSGAIRLLNVFRNATELSLEVLLRVGELYATSGRQDLAQRFYRAGLSLATQTGNRLAEGYFLIQAGHAMSADERAEAVRNYRSAYDLFRLARYSRGTAYALLALAAETERTGRLVDALELYGGSVAESERVAAHPGPDDMYVGCEERFAGRAWGPAYDELIGLMIQVGKNDSAFWYLERKNRWDLRFRLADQRPRGRDTLTTRLLEDLVRSRTRRIGGERMMAKALSEQSDHQELLEDIQASLDRSQQEMTDAAERLLHSRPALDLLARVSGMRVTDAQTVVPANGTLIMYAMTRRGLYAFTVERSRAGVDVSGIPADRVRDAIREYYDLLALRAPRVDSADAETRSLDKRLQDLTRTLYEACVLPVESTVRSADALFIVSPAGMPVFPVHALRRGSSDTFVIERQIVSNISAAAALRFAGPDRGPVTNVLCVGHPGETGWDVEYELRDVRAFYRDAAMVFGQQASLGLLAQRSADVVHIAASVVWSDEHPGNSYLVLSDGRSRETFTREPLGVLLSLPGSGAMLLSNLTGRASATQGAYASLVHANGTPVVVTNSVTPGRKAKKVFGELFYTSLLEGSSVPQAHQKALQEMIGTRTTAAPAFWAPFMLWGTRIR